MEKEFRPEFINRLDEIIVFRPLTREDMKQIVHLEVNHVRERLRAHDMEMDLSPEAAELLIEKGYDPDFGARPLSRVIQRDIVDAMADAVLFGDLAKGGNVVVAAEDGEFTFSFSPPAGRS